MIRRQIARPPKGGGTDPHLYQVIAGQELFPSGKLGVKYADPAPTELPEDYDLATLPTTIDGVGIGQSVIDNTMVLLANYDGATGVAGDLQEGQTVYCPTVTTLPIDGGGTATLRAVSTYV